jgi:hypothetical protein
MDKERLKALQAPLKAKYRDDPHSAVVTLHAEGLASEGVSCRLDLGRALVDAGLHQAAGRWFASLLGRYASPGSRSLRRSYAASGRDFPRDPSERGKNFGRGDLDFRGTLAIAKDAPVGFRAIRLHILVDTEADLRQYRS